MREQLAEQPSGDEDPSRVYSNFVSFRVDGGAIRSPSPDGLRRLR